MMVPDDSTDQINGNSNDTDGNSIRKRETPQMLTLGRDGDDFAAVPRPRLPRAATSLPPGVGTPVGTMVSSESSMVASETARRHDQQHQDELPRQKGSWFRRFVTQQPNADDMVTSIERTQSEDYVSMEEEGDGNHTNHLQQGRQQLQTLHHVDNLSADACYAILGDSSEGGAASSIALQQQPEGLDDPLQNSFFFRENDHGSAGGTTTSSNRRRRDERPRRSHLWKTVRRSNRHGQLFAYSDAVEPVLSPPMLQLYRARYAQLNQELYPSEQRQRDRHSNFVRNGIEDDLQLREEGVAGNDDNDNHADNHHGYTDASGLPIFLVRGSNNSDGTAAATNVNDHTDERIVRTDTVRQSSLFYETYDGQKFMRLPRDRVRLLMDPDLEAGILSVDQQCSGSSSSSPRSRSYKTSKSVNSSSSYETTADPESTEDDLRYALTVDENLYRQIVAEMSPRHLLSIDEKLDIRVAYCLLGAVLLILLINTLAYHED